MLLVDFFRRATGHQEDLRAAAVTETRRQAGLEQKLRKKSKKALKSLSKSEKEVFDYLYKRGQQMNNGAGGWIKR